MLPLKSLSFFHGVMKEALSAAADDRRPLSDTPPPRGPSPRVAAAAAVNKDAK